jgi:hypothetical protein
MIYRITIVICLLLIAAQQYGLHKQDAYLLELQSHLDECESAHPAAPRCVIAAVPVDPI